MAWGGGWQIGTSAVIPLEITEKLQYGIGKKKSVGWGIGGSQKLNVPPLEGWKERAGWVGGSIGSGTPDISLMLFQQHFFQ